MEDKNKASVLNNLQKEGKVIIFSAPSGAGKTTVVRHLLSNNTCFGFSISACTRLKRAHETEGKDYYFLDSTTFLQKVTNQEFIEWEEVYEGLYYGTLKSEVECIWNEGKHVLFDVDVKGGLNLKKYFGNKALAVFIAAPSIEVVEKRLRNRNTETEDSIRKRLAKYRFEMSFEKEFDKVIINENLENTLDEAQKIVNEFLD